MRAIRMPDDLFENFTKDNLRILDTRRAFLTTSGLALGALILSPSEVQAATKKYGVDLNRLPKDWVRYQGGNIFRYAKYINSLGLRNITAEQVIAVHARKKGSTWNTLPPKQYWKNISKTLKVMDNLARAMREPVKEIVSLYRSPAYNARCRGAKPNSYHKKNIAMDVQMHSSPYRVYQLARHYRDKRRGFEGGLGSYRSFTHIDTRGFNATW